MKIVARFFSMPKRNLLNDSKPKCQNPMRCPRPRASTNPKALVRRIASWTTIKKNVMNVKWLKRIPRATPICVAVTF